MNVLIVDKILLKRRFMIISKRIIPRRGEKNQWQRRLWLTTNSGVGDVLLRSIKIGRKRQSLIQRLNKVVLYFNLAPPKTKKI